MKYLSSKYNIPLILILLIFGSIFCAISLVNHYLYRTEALDLGMFNHAIYSFSRFENAIFSLSTDGSITNYFADHFAPITVLLAPFRYVFGTYTLLIAQIVAILFGGYGVFKLAIQAGIKHWLALIILIQFYSMWGIYSALSFDFHTNVLAAMFVPWLVYFYHTKNKGWFLVFFLLILISKENMALWLGFIMLGLIIRKKPNWHNYLRFEIPLTVLAFAYSIFVIGWVMPELSASGENLQMGRYGHLGEGFSSKIQTLLFHPLETIDLFFDQSRFPDAPEGIKMEFHYVMLLSGGVLVFMRPRYLVMLIPIYAQKFLSSSMGQWGIDAQYSIEFVPIICIAAIDVARGITNFKIKAISLVGIAISTIIVSIVKMESRVIPMFDNTKVAFYCAKHYQVDLDVDEISRALSFIPLNSSICTSSNLAPHIAFRDKLFLFPNINNAEYIVLIHGGRNLYPSNRDGLNVMIDALAENGEYDFIHYGTYTMVLRRADIAQKLLPLRLQWNARMDHYRHAITTDSLWLEAVRKKSIHNGISLDSMIQMDALYLVEQELKENNNGTLSNP